ncbi:MAG: peptide chain release factor 1 [Nitrospiraceae bacterium]|nr:peptide chain release factor 1 [Nitrospiraceae bacterium]
MEKALIQKLDEISLKYGEIERQLSKPEIIADQGLFRKLSMEYKELQPVCEAYGEYKNTLNALSEALDVIKNSTDSDFIELAKEERKNLDQKLSSLELRIKKFLIPKDKNDERDIILEIRAGAGGEEAGLFARDLFRMYSRYAERKGWSVEIVSMNETGLEGIKEIIATISGKGAYSKLKYESGVHRVQRIPVTESGGRIHTSTATVAILPEARETDVKLNREDIRIDTYRASGAGGQHVNKTDSAVRMTHIPTGIVVTCSNERSQIQNRQKAMKILMARLKELKEREERQKLESTRRVQIGTGDRSEKIRTYNFPENRVTDHRIKLTLYNLENFLDGEMDEMIDALTAAEESKRIEALSKG